MIHIVFLKNQGSQVPFRIQDRQTIFLYWNCFATLAMNAFLPESLSCLIPKTRCAVPVLPTRRPNNVAGLSVQNLGPGQSQVAIRGISAGQVVRDQPGVKEQLGVYLDESVISLSLFTPDLDFFDMNRVEVAVPRAPCSVPAPSPVRCATSPTSPTSRSLKAPLKPP